MLHLTVKTTKRWALQATRKNDSQTRRVAVQQHGDCSNFTDAKNDLHTPRVPNNNKLLPFLYL